MPAIFTHPPFLGRVPAGSSVSTALLASVARIAPLLIEQGSSSSSSESLLDQLPANCEYWIELNSDSAAVAGGRTFNADAATQLLDAGASRVVTSSPELAAELQNPERVILRIDNSTSTLLSQPGVIDSVAGLLVELPDTDATKQAELLGEFRLVLGGKKKADSKLLFFSGPASSSASVNDVATMAQLDSKPTPCVGLDKLSSSDIATLFTSGLKTDRTDGLFATLVAGASGEPLGLVYSSQASLAMSVESGDATYYSRSRNSLWKKGETSGATQKVRRIRIDCDADALQFEVEQKVGTGFCQ